MHFVTLSNSTIHKLKKCRIFLFYFYSISFLLFFAVLTWRTSFNGSSFGSIVSHKKCSVMGDAGYLLRKKILLKKYITKWCHKHFRRVLGSSFPLWEKATEKIL